jgi:hypothetical protein
MFEKLKAFYGVFQSGKMVANPLAWKKGQMTGGLVAAFIGALITVAKVFDYDIHLDDEQIVQIGGAIVAIFGLFNAGATVATTDKFGLQPTGNEVPKSDSASSQVLSAAHSTSSSTTEVPYVRRAANGDILDGLDTTYTGG